MIYFPWVMGGIGVIMVVHSSFSYPMADCTCENLRRCMKEQCGEGQLDGNICTLNDISMDVHRMCTMYEQSELLHCPADLHCPNVHED